MSPGRNRLERIVSRIAARPVPDFAPPPHPLAEGLYAIDRRWRLPGGATLPTRSVAVRLADGGLVLIAPPPLEPAVREALSSLGPLRALVAPNSFHYLALPAWATTLPGVEVHLAPGLAERRPELPPGRSLGPSPPPLWAGQLDQAVFGPVRGVSEVAFHHPASRTLLLTDLAFNLRGETDRRSRLMWRLYGAWEHFGPSRAARWMLLQGSEAVGDFVRRLLAWDFDRIVVAHGEAVESGGRAALEAAFAEWLG